MTAYFGSVAAGGHGGYPHGGTPEWLLNFIRENEGPIFDPCPNNPTFDGLKIPWPKATTVYVNPPFNRIDKKRPTGLSSWAEKAFNEYLSGSRVILLMPLYTCTSYFHEYIAPNADITFIEGRVKFKGYSGGASFPVMLCTLDLSTNTGGKFDTLPKCLRAIHTEAV